MRRCRQSPTENRIGKVICSRTRRTPRDKSLPTDGTAPTRANRQLFPRRRRATTNSGPQLAASTTSTAIGICSALARQWKSSKKGSARALCFRRQLRGADSGGNKAKCAAVGFLDCSGTGFVIFGVAVHLPQIVKPCVGENIFHAQHRCHHGVILVVVFMHAVTANQVQVWITRLQFLANH